MTKYFNWLFLCGRHCQEVHITSKDEFILAVDFSGLWVLNKACFNIVGFQSKISDILVYDLVESSTCFSAFSTATNNPGLPYVVSRVVPQAWTLNLVIWRCSDKIWKAYLGLPAWDELLQLNVDCNSWMSIFGTAAIITAIGLSSSMVGSNFLYQFWRPQYLLNKSPGLLFPFILNS